MQRTSSNELKFVRVTHGWADSPLINKDLYQLVEIKDIPGRTEPIAFIRPINFTQ